MSLKQLILGSHMCYLGHEHSSKDDMVQCNEMEQKRRELKNKKEEEERLLKFQAKEAELQRQHEKEMIEKQLEYEKVKLENSKNEQKANQKSKVCSLM